jgi:hypothetical protein
MESFTKKWLSRTTGGIVNTVATVRQAKEMGPKADNI